MLMNFGIVDGNVPPIARDIEILPGSLPNMPTIMLGNIIASDEDVFDPVSVGLDDQTTGKFQELSAHGQYYTEIRRRVKRFLPPR